ncbi:hypothetical protein SFA35_19890 [Pseudomonas sp. HR96]|uniref:hypothetical protein n=1 Tax=Pseudomonas sp. HR96 TaxID=1027966 RepID=UPI002A765AE0|nr:hypothetical protein [Pseudomonas sp. HR96]WPO98859.1 hypothetical protein SFA35_19890 [Pseudomonas sp. HR96]
MASSTIREKSAMPPATVDISLSNIIRALWSSRWVIIGTTMVIMAITAISVGTHEKYESSGLYQFGGPIPLDSSEGIGITLSDYKRYATAMQESDRFERYVNAMQIAETPGLQVLKDTFDSFGGIGQQIEPLHSFTQADAKTLFTPKDVGNNILGLRIHLKDGDPKVAQQMVGLVGRYIMDVIAYDAFTEKLLADNTDNAVRSLEIDNEMLENRLETAALKRRQAVLQEIVKREPKNSEATSAQTLITVDEKNVPFLPAGTQLVATEIQLDQLNETSMDLEHEKKQLMLMSMFNESALKMHKEVQSGEIFLNNMPVVLSKFFEGKDMKDDDVLEVYNTLSITIQKAEALYLKNCRFVAGPTLPNRPAINMSTALLIALAGGFFLGLLIALVRSWAINNLGAMKSGTE